MEGARWNRATMCIDETMHGQLYDAMPLILLQPCKRCEKLDNDELLYDAPVFRTSSRKSVTTKSGHASNFVTFFKLKSEKPVNHWMFRGAALLCQIND